MRASRLVPAWPWIIVVLMLAGVYNPFVAFQRLSTWPPSYALTAALLAVLAGALATRRKWRQAEPWLRFGIAPATFGAVLLIAALRGVSLGNAPLTVATDLFQAGELVLGYYLAAAALRDAAVRRAALGALSIVLVTTSAWEVLAYGLRETAWFAATFDTPELPLARLEHGDVRSTVSPIPSLALPVLLSVLLIARARLPRRVQLAVGAAVILTSVAVLLTFKRSAWAAMAVALVLVLMLAARYHGRAGIAALATVLAGLVAGVGTLALVLPVGQGSLWSAVHGRMALTAAQLGFASGPEGPTSEAPGTSMDGRAATPDLPGGRAGAATLRPSVREVAGIRTRRAEYGDVWTELRISPLLGRGLGAEYVGYRRQQIGAKHFVHNTYLAVALRTGLIGLGVFLLTMGATVAGIGRTLRHNVPDAGAWAAANSDGASAVANGDDTLAAANGDEELAVAIGAGALAAVAGMAIQSLATGLLLTHPVSLVCGVLLGLAKASTDTPALQSSGIHAILRPARS